jgi:integrase
MGGGNGRALNRLAVRTIDKWATGAEAGAKLSDGGGLFLRKLDSGATTWQLKYRHGGIERTFSVGQVNLAKAREERERVKQLLKQGVDPVQAQRLRRIEKVASSGELFGDLMDLWLKKEKPGWSAIHYDKSSKALERHVTPDLGKLPVRDITPAMISVVIEKIQARGRRETAAKILQHVRSIFRYAAAKGLRTDNPAEPVVEILARAKLVKHRPALLTFPALGELLRKAEMHPVSPAVRLCHRLIAFTAVRVSNAVEAGWEEFDLNAKPALWTIPRSKMKIRGRTFDHKVVLPGTLVADLREWREAQQSPRKGFVFPGFQGRDHLTRESIEKALHSMGYQDRHTCHGWRASFSTLAKDHGIDRQVVDLALDHIHDTDVARAYDRGERLQKRIQLMQWWGQALDRAQRGAEVLPIRRTG